MYKIIWQQIVLVIETRFDFLSNTTIQDSWQSLHLYVLLIQDIGSSHSLVSFDHRILPPLHICFYFTKLTFQVLYFSLT